jgi:hypothetical protein
MIFKQYEDGSCDIKFSWRERLILLKSGKLHLSGGDLKHFGDHLVKMVSDWHLKFDEETRKKITFGETKIEGK